MNTATRRPGPAIEHLTRRLAETPPDFLARAGKLPQAQVDAVLFDLLRRLGDENPDPKPLGAFVARAEPRLLRLVLLGAWLLAEPWFCQQRCFAAAARDWLLLGLKPLAEIVEVEAMLADDERREEFARLCLAALELLPAGESPEKADDRLTTVSSIERQRVVKASKVAEERARKVREEIARKAAAEAAAKSSRE